jgi:hypothetical protein
MHYLSTENNVPAHHPMNVRQMQLEAVLLLFHVLGNGPKQLRFHQLSHHYARIAFGGMSNASAREQAMLQRASDDAEPALGVPS